MKMLYRIMGVGCFAVLFLPLLFAQGPQPDPRKEAQGIFKAYRDKLDRGKPVSDVIHSLKTVEAIADEIHSGAIHDIERMLNHPDPAVRRQAAKTLGAIGVVPHSAKNRVEVLARQLNDPDPEVVASILFSLVELGPYAKPALPKALEAYKSPDARIRRAAIIMVGSFLVDNKELMRVVISALDDPDTGADEKKPGLNSVSMLAMFAFRARTPEAKDAVPKLVRLVKDKKGDDFYRMVALNAIAFLAPEDPLPLNTAREWLKRHDSPEDLIKGSGLLARLGSHGKPAVPELVAVLKINPLADAFVEQRLKLSILSAFRSIGPAAKDALPAIRALPSTNDFTVRRQVLKTIEVLEGNK